MFNYCLILNAQPFFVLAQNETDLEEILKVYQDKVVSVIKGDSIQVMEFKLQMSLSSKPTLLIPEIVDEEKDSLMKMVSNSEKEEMLEDLTENIN